MDEMSDMGAVDTTNHDTQIKGLQLYQKSK